MIFKGRQPQNWSHQPTPEEITTAVERGKDDLQKRTELEKKRTPLARDTPASRAQRAAATSKNVKPMANNAYAAEQATRLLFNG